LQALRHISGIRSATVFGQSIHLLVDESISEEMLRSQLNQAGIAHADIRPIAPSLEDVFVALTTDEQHNARKAA
jgi:hypothetical protein